MPSLEVPSWLQPPSEMQRQQMALMEDEVKQKGVSMLRKQIGFAKMKQDAANMVATGVDEPTARKQALINNADLIFADNPQAVVQLQHNDEADAIRERAQFMLNQHRERADAVLQQRANELEAHHQELEAEKTAGRLSKEELANKEMELKSQKLQNDLLRTQGDLAHKRILEQNSSAQLKIQQDKEARLTKKDAMADKQLATLNSDLADAQDQLETYKSKSIHWPWGAKAADLEKRVMEAQQKRDARAKALGLSSVGSAPTADQQQSGDELPADFNADPDEPSAPAPTAPAAPQPKVFKYNRVTRRLE